MFSRYKKIVVVAILCAGIISVSIMMIWGNQYRRNVLGSGKKKYTSWALAVPIDPNKLYPVAEVVDGDTLKINIAGHVITTRLLGVNTPEVVDPRKPIECYGKEASEESKKLMTGKSVFVAVNQNYERVDKFGRLLAYVWLAFDLNKTSLSTSSALFVNNYLIKEGYGREYTFNSKKPYQYQKIFTEGEMNAKKLKKGLWGSCGEK